MGPSTTLGQPTRTLVPPPLSLAWWVRKGLMNQITERPSLGDIAAIASSPRLSGGPDLPQPSLPDRRGPKTRLSGGILILRRARGPRTTAAAPAAPAAAPAPWRARRLAARHRSRSAPQRCPQAPRDRRGRSRY